MNKKEHDWGVQFMHVGDNINKKRLSLWSWLAIVRTDCQTRWEKSKPAGHYLCSYLFIKSIYISCYILLGIFPTGVPLWVVTWVQPSIFIRIIEKYIISEIYNLCPLSNASVMSQTLCLATDPCGWITKISVKNRRSLISFWPVVAINLLKSYHKNANSTNFCAS